jgi:hypothetical protein
MAKFKPKQVPWNKNPKESICRNCGKHFMVSHCERGEFCSLSCYWESMKVSLKYHCAICGKEFSASPSHNRQFCSRKCSDAARENIPLSLETRNKISEKHKGKVYRHNYHHSEKTKGKIGNSNRGKVRPPVSSETRLKLSKVAKEHCAQPGVKEQRSALMKERWQKDRNTLIRITKKVSTPNKPEGRILSILDKFFPNEWQYTGDGRLRIGGYKPDFTNCNGHKFIIEFFGDYWHREDVITNWASSELGRIMAYNGLGFKTLILWDSQIHNLSDYEVAVKIRKFFKLRLHEKDIK